jgi:hypothetical protein
MYFPIWYIASKDGARIFLTNPVVMQWDGKSKTIKYTTLTKCSPQPAA